MKRKQTELSKKTSYQKLKAKYSVVSFFCGCGGLDLGFAGGFSYKEIKIPKLPFEVLAAYDNDENCIKTYRQNIADHAEVKDLSSYNPHSCPPADILIGGFPCQDFSVCGPRAGLKSHRGRLYQALIQYMEVHKPMIVVGENVPGLANVMKGEILETIKKELSGVGYQVEVWTLFAPDYGIPQNRTRLFIVAVRDDLNGFPSIPIKKYTNEEYRTIKWAIDDLKQLRDDSVPNQSQYFKAAKSKNRSQGDETSPADSPSYTIRANSHSHIQFHYALKRRLTVRECARIQTFPDDFIFPHSTTTNMMQIGNAVPPLLGNIVAKSVFEFLEKLK